LPYATATDGARIFYRAAGDGPPLLISNASFSTHRHWLAQQERLSRRLRVVVWDYRGHGLSDAPDDPARGTS
jgi:3-oxoadipate enol-lactonase